MAAFQLVPCAPTCAADPEVVTSEAIVNRHVRRLFKLLPRLSGFRLGADLVVVDVSVCASPAFPARRGLYPFLLQAIVELAECHPEAVQLVRGRTFERGLS